MLIRPIVLIRSRCQVFYVFIVLGFFPSIMERRVLRSLPTIMDLPTSP